MSKTIVSFQFSNAKAANCFLEWLSNSGEQSYWEAMEYVEEDIAEGNITAVEFDYWSLNKGKTFGPKVKMVCGRLDNTSYPLPNPIDDE
jgi:guanylate kinase